MNFSYRGFFPDIIAQAYRDLANELITNNIGPATTEISRRILDSGILEKIAAAADKPSLLEVIQDTIGFSALTEPAAKYFALRKATLRHTYAVIDSMGGFDVPMLHSGEGAHQECERFAKANKNVPKQWRTIPKPAKSTYGTIAIDFSVAAYEAGKPTEVTYEEAKQHKMRVYALLTGTREITRMHDYNSIGIGRNANGLVISLSNASEDTLNFLRANMDKVGGNPRQVGWEPYPS